MILVFKTMGITDPVGRESDDEALEIFCKPLSSKMEDTRSLGLGNQIRPAYR